MGAPRIDPKPFDFRPRQPGPPLGELVESIWYARGTVPYARERIAPTGSTVAVFVLGDPILHGPADDDRLIVRATAGFLVGPHDRPSVNQPTGETFAVGVVASPVGCRSLFGIDPGSIRGRVVDLAEIWPPAVGLRHQLLAYDGPDAMLDGLEVALLEVSGSGQGRRPSPAVERCRSAVASLEADPTRPIAEIAAELDISHGHLDREFGRVVGLTPRVLARLLRMRRLLAELDVHGQVGWSERAAELGWYDQAHLIRDFKRHTGVTPSDYLAAQRASFTSVDRAADAAGFVPER